MEREGAKPLEGRVAWLILLVVVSVCVMFCVLCSNRQPDNCAFFSGRNFIQFCNNWCSYFDTTDDYLAIIITTGKERYSRLSGGCTIIITTGKKSSSRLFGGCAIVITNGKKDLVLCLAGV